MLHPGDFSLGMKLFELYLSLQQFYQHRATTTTTTLTSDISSSTPLKSGLLVKDSRETFPYHKWFIRAVAKWLDIALFKAIKRILKAVELDNLQTVDDLVRHTSSAVDIRTVFAQIKTFWMQLQWPDAETAYVFISRILDDVCR